MQTRIATLVSLLLFAGVIGGCVVPIRNDSPFLQDRLKRISAGFTGCPVAENKLSNMDVAVTAEGSWNVTCRGQTYLCTGVSVLNESRSFQCAPAVQ
jgi:hypothetical protein